MPSADLPIHTAVLPQRVDRDGLSIRQDVLYTDAKGRDRSKLHKSADDTFEDMGEVLRRVLEPNETIFYIAAAQMMPSAAAQFFGGGWHRYSLPGTLLIFTEHRVIAFRVRKRMNGWDWNRGIRTARWGDVESAVAKGFVDRYLVLKLRNGERQSYWRFASGDFKKVRMLIDILRTHGSGEATAAGAMVSLCPVCLATLSPRNYRCPACGLPFKDEKTLLWRGVLIPGGASLYVGATALGVLRSIFEAILLVSITVSILTITREPKNSAAVATLIGSVILEGCALILDKTLAIIYSRSQNT